jgi:ketosteroid isomerase-like protein
MIEKCLAQTATRAPLSSTVRGHAMRPVFATLSVVGICILAACTSSPPIDSQRLELEEANRKYDAALLEGDRRVLGELYAEEFRYFGPKEVVRSKAEQIEALTSGAVDLISGGSSDVEVLVFDSTAVLTGKFSGRVRVNGREFAFRERYSTVWVKRRNIWRLVLEHGSVIEEG